MEAADSLFNEPFGANPAELITEAKMVDFNTIDSVLKESKRVDLSSVVICCFGVTWSYPSFASLLHFQAAKQEAKADCFRLFAVNSDEAEERRFCMKSGVVVGNTFLICWYKGKQLEFERQSWGIVDKVVGSFNRQKISSFLESLTKEALQSNQPIKCPI